MTAMVAAPLPDEETAMPSAADTSLGESLHALVPDPLPTDPTTLPEGSSFATLAADTPLIRRIAAVCARLDEADVLEAEPAMGLAALAAPCEHIDGAFEHAAVLAGWLLWAVEEPGVVRFDPRDDPLSPLICTGPQRALVEEHPLAVWGQSLIPSLLGASDGGLLDIVGRGPVSQAMWFVPATLYEVLVCARTVNEGDVINALHREAQATGLARTHPRPFTRRSIAMYVAVIRALLVELGLARWAPQQGRRRGDLEVTPLGRLGLLIVKAELGGVWPELDAFFRKAGYLPCDGGYVKLADVPVDISPN
jgi:hypothetical protein